MKELNQAEKQIGKVVYYSTEGMEIKCRIDGVKVAYGRILYKIAPLMGKGFKWTTKEPGDGLRRIGE